MELADLSRPLAELYPLYLDSPHFVTGRAGEWALLPSGLMFRYRFRPHAYSHHLRYEELPLAAALLLAARRPLLKEQGYNLRGRLVRLRDVYAMPNGEDGRQAGILLRRVEDDEWRSQALLKKDLRRAADGITALRLAAGLPTPWDPAFLVPDRYTSKYDPKVVTPPKAAAPTRARRGKA